MSYRPSADEQLFIYAHVACQVDLGSGPLSDVDHQNWPKKSGSSSQSSPSVAAARNLLAKGLGKVRRGRPQITVAGQGLTDTVHTPNSSVTYWSWSPYALHMAVASLPKLSRGCGQQSVTGSNG